MTTKLTMAQAEQAGDLHARKLAEQAITYLARQKLEGHVTVILHLRAADNPARPEMIAVMTVGASSLPPAASLPMVHTWAEDQLTKLAQDDG